VTFNRKTLRTELRVERSPGRKPAKIGGEAIYGAHQRVLPVYIRTRKKCEHSGAALSNEFLAGGWEDGNSRLQTIFRSAARESRASYCSHIDPLPMHPSAQQGPPIPHWGSIEVERCELLLVMAPAPPLISRFTCPPHCGQDSSGWSDIFCRRSKWVSQESQ